MKLNTSLFTLFFLFLLIQSFDTNAYQMKFSAQAPYTAIQKNINKGNTPTKKNNLTKANPKSKKQTPPSKNNPPSKIIHAKTPKNPKQTLPSTKKVSKKPPAKPVVKQTSQQIKKNNSQNNPTQVRVNEKNYESYWDKGTFPTTKQSIEYHTKKHANGKSALKYTNEATKFYNENKNIRKNTVLSNGSEGYKITKGKIGGIWTKEGKIVTYWVDP